MRLGSDEKDVTELLGLTEHCRSMNKVAFGLMLEDDQGREEPIIPYPADEQLDVRSREILHLVAEHEGNRLGRPGVPKFWRRLARNVHYLHATWAKHQLLFDRPGIEPAAKLAVGLGVSVTNGCRYFIRYFTDAIRHAGWDDGKILEVIGVVDHYNSFNTIASGMQIESDITTETALEE